MSPPYIVVMALAAIMQRRSLKVTPYNWSGSIPSERNFSANTATRLAWRHLRRSSPSHPATVDHEDVPVHVVGGAGGEEDGGSDEILGFSPAARRDPLEDLAAAPVVGAERGGVGRSHVARSDRVHVHSASGPLVRQGSRDRRDSRLRSGVGGNPDPTLEGEEGGDVDDLAVTGGEHSQARLAAEPEDAPEIDVENVVPVLVGGLLGARASDRPGVVDEDLETAQSRGRFRHEPGRRREIGEVSRDGGGPDT